MGRPPLTDEKKREVTCKIIRATNEMMLQNKQEIPTIRMVADYAGVNLATIYKYFRDQDELRLFACIDIFKHYVSDLVNESMEGQSARERYEISWRLFCRYAFRYPEVINLLFFGKHSEDLGYVVQRYYDLFPEQLEDMPDCYQDMLLNANLYKRNFEVLKPTFASSVSRERISLINELTVLYFGMLLNERITLGTEEKNEELTNRMLHVADELLKFTD